MRRLFDISFFVLCGMVFSVLAVHYPHAANAEMSLKVYRTIEIEQEDASLSLLAFNAIDGSVEQITKTSQQIVVPRNSYVPVTHSAAGKKISSHNHRICGEIAATPRNSSFTSRASFFNASGGGIRSNGNLLHFLRELIV